MTIRPEQFDWLGLIVFPFIAGSGVYALATDATLPTWVLVAFVFIGIGGIIIDGSIVYRYFIKTTNQE